MLKPHMLLSAMLFGFAALAAYGQDAKLEVEIKASRASVRNKALFSVSTLIRNTSGEEQSLFVLDCGYSRQWAVDNPSLKPAGECCLQNAISKIRLRPGGVYERKVRLLASLPAGSTAKEAMAFRLGFTSEDDPMASRTGANAAKDSPPKI
jgi:hypothetical protein